MLDTHTLIWWMIGSSRLSGEARTIIEYNKNVSLASAASAWEIATKVRLGRLPAAKSLTQSFEADLREQKMELLDVAAEHAIRAGLLPGPQKDPFDRMLIAQGLSENVPIVSKTSLWMDIV